MVKVISGVTRGGETQHEVFDSKFQLFLLYDPASLTRQTWLIYFFKLAYNNAVLLMGQALLGGLSTNISCNPQNNPVRQSLLLLPLYR